MESAIVHRLFYFLNFLTANNITYCNGSTCKLWLVTILEILKGSYDSGKEIRESETYSINIAVTASNQHALTCADIASAEC